jgi:hypothetical protein
MLKFRFAIMAMLFALSTVFGSFALALPTQKQQEQRQKLETEGMVAKRYKKRHRHYRRRPVKRHRRHRRRPVYKKHRPSKRRYSHRRGGCFISVTSDENLILLLIRKAKKSLKADKEKD